MVRQLRSGGADNAEGVLSNNYTFPNVATRGGANDELDLILTAELEAAGIEACKLPFTISGEVPSRLIGSLEKAGWSFQRAWHYWEARGPGIPPEYAERLHAEHGKSARVDGRCGAPSPREHFGGFAVGYYHVDTSEGLRALADTIKSVLSDAERILRRTE